MMYSDFRSFGYFENDKIVDNPMVLWIKRKIEEKYKIQFGIPLILE